jgi:hypothetical protein
MTTQETVDKIFEEAMAKRQPCPSLIEEIMADIDNEDEEE